jgi:L-lactate dehydrogenase complex protein LldG
VGADARSVVLARVRAALGSAPAVPEVPRAYRGPGDAGPTASPAVVERFAERAADYTATVHRTDPSGLPSLLARLLRDERVVVAPGVGAEAVGLDVVADTPRLDARALAEVDAVLTGCALAIAETGTIVLDHAATSGRRALTLVPDHHVCLVRAGQVVGGLPDAIAALDPRRPTTFVSGPSATSDIELERVEGVHGPRRLDVVLVLEGPQVAAPVST